MHAGFAGQAQQLHLRRAALPERPQIRERIPGGDDAQAVAGGGQALQQRGDALVLQLTRRGRSGRVLQRLEAVEDEKAATLAHDAGEALTFLERTGVAGGKLLVRIVAEENQGFLEEQIGGSGSRRAGLAAALAVEGPSKGGVAAGPVLSGQFRRPLGHERGLPLAAGGNKGEDTRAAFLRAHGFDPGVVEELQFVFASDEIGGRVFDDAVDVESAFPSAARSEVNDVPICERGRNRAILDPDGNDTFREAASALDFTFHPLRTD
ncbi:MAG TPA: hypothetical protein VIT21_05840 [Chthoniobacterales bacterium]